MGWPAFLLSQRLVWDGSGQRAGVWEGARPPDPAAVPAEVERTNTWHKADYTRSDVTILPSKSASCEGSCPHSAGAAGGTTCQLAHGAALFLLKRGVGATGPPSRVLTVLSTRTHYFTSSRKSSLKLVCYHPNDTDLDTEEHRGHMTSQGRAIRKWGSTRTCLRHAGQAGIFEAILSLLFFSSTLTPALGDLSRRSTDASLLT